MDAERRDDAGPFVTSVGSGRVQVKLSLLTRNTSSLMFLSGEPLSYALEQIRVELERKNRRDISKIAGLRDEEREEREEMDKVVSANMMWPPSHHHTLSFLTRYFLQAAEAAAYEESEGLRLIRGGRDARLASFRGRGSREGSFSAVGASRGHFNASFR